MNQTKPDPVTETQRKRKCIDSRRSALDRATGGFHTNHFKYQTCATNLFALVFGQCQSYHVEAMYHFQQHERLFEEVDQCLRSVL